jgi:acetoin utilization protein AcuC
MACSATAIWDEGYLAYDFGEHPMNPVRLELTIRLARELGVLDRLDVLPPKPADEQQLLTVHAADYLAAVHEAGDHPDFSGYGLGTDDDPVFPGIYEASALIAGGSAIAAQQVWDGHVQHAVNIAGGLHHAMNGYASGFCVFNDVVLAIRTLLAAGAQRVAYVDIDVHHGDGVQAAFYDDPRVLTISLHEHPATLFPGTGLPGETGSGDGDGYAVNVALPAGTGDAGWLRALDAVAVPLLRTFKPTVLVTQHGCDSHRLDPLAHLELSVDGQRQAQLVLHELAHELCDGRWIATGGGGYALVQVVPRTWTHLLAVAAGTPLDQETETPARWRELARSLTGETAPLTMTDGEPARYAPFTSGIDPGDPVDRAILRTRSAVFPSHGLAAMLIFAG